MVEARRAATIVISAHHPPSGNRHSTAFSERVGRQFGRHASGYDAQARLQRGVAWRLAHGFDRQKPRLPRGPMADLGAGSGSLSRALISHGDSITGRPLQQLDICPELLALGPAAPAHRLRWDLNRGLPAGLGSAALLASNFALQWLESPTIQLTHWCDHLAPGGWLLLGVPTAGSYPQWRQAAAVAGVPCTALELPTANELIAVVRGGGLELLHCQQLRFTHRHYGGLKTLRHLRGLGAGCSRGAPLSPMQMRRLLACWPDSSHLTWEVLVLVGRRASCDW